MKTTFLFPLFLLVACTPKQGAGTGSACMTDADCGSGEVCANTEECAQPSSLIAVHVSWTIGGQTPTPMSPAACANVNHLAVSVLDSYDQSEITWSPVTCTPPLMTFTKLPTRFDTIEVDARDSGDATIGVGMSPIPTDTTDAQVMVALPAI
jgi:hypothetical protein